MDQDVVDAVIHQVLAHRIVHAGTRGHQHLRADAVRREYEHRPLEARRHPHHAAERSEPAERERGAGGAGQLDDAAPRLLGDVAVHARRRVAVGHGSTSKSTSCLKPRTRARTSASVTPSNPWMPNFSTAKDPMAAPYTMARRRFAGERSPLFAR